MKIIHFADLHIGSKFERMPNDIKTELNTKLRNAFAKIIDYAKENNIHVILKGFKSDYDNENVENKNAFIHIEHDSAK